MAEEVTYYELSRAFFNWSFENADKINPNHVALYFFCLEHNNRLAQKNNFKLPMEMAMEAIGIKNYKTWSKTFQDLIDFGFIELIQKSTNQYSANRIALVKNTKASYKARGKALDIATLKHSQKQGEKQVHGIVGVNKPITNNQETIEPLTIRKSIPPEINWVKDYCLERKNLVDPEKFFNHYTSNGWIIGKTKMKDWQASIRTWEKNNFNNAQNGNQFTGKNTGQTAHERSKENLADFAERNREFLRAAGNNI